MNFWENFKNFCNAVEKSPSQVTAECGLSNSIITKWKRGSMPDGRTVAKLAEYFNIPIDALFATNDNIVSIGTETEKIIRKLSVELNCPYSELVEIYQTKKYPTAINENNLRHFFMTALDMYNNNKRERSVNVKIYGTIAAGIPIDAIEDVIDEEEIPAAMAHGSEYIGLKVKGDSMEPLISNGAHAILRVQPDCESGQIAAVLINGDEATLKRVIKQSNGIVLLSENPKYKPMFFSFDEIENRPVTIIGVLKEIRMKF